MKSRLLRIVLLTACCCGLIGCASIPPAALTHVSALKAYNKKAGEATLGAFDSSTATIKYTVENWKQADALDSQEYIDACKETSDLIASTSAGLGAIADLAAQMPSVDQTTKRTELAAKIDARVKELQQQLQKSKDSFDRAATKVKTRAATNAAAFTKHARDVDLAAMKLRSLIQDSSDTVTDGLT